MPRGPVSFPIRFCRSSRTPAGPCVWRHHKEQAKALVSTSQRACARGGDNRRCFPTAGELTTDEAGRRARNPCIVAGPCRHQLVPISPVCRTSLVGSVAAPLTYFHNQNANANCRHSEHGEVEEHANQPATIQNIGSPNVIAFSDPDFTSFVSPLRTNYGLLASAAKASTHNTVVAMPIHEEYSASIAASCIKRRSGTTRFWS